MKDDIKRRLYELYKIDFDLFGYEPGTKRQIGSAIRPKTVAWWCPLVLYYVTQQIPLALINRFFII